MLALILDQDQHSCEVLHTMLLQLGFNPIIKCSDAREFDLYCTHFGNRIGVMLATFQSEEGLDLPLSRMVIQNRALGLAPLISMTDRGFKFALNNTRSRLSRIDAYVHRPFGIEELKTALFSAFERRADFRNILVVLKQEGMESAIEATFDNQNDSHWKETIFVKNLDEMKKKYQDLGFIVGGLLLDSSLLNEDIQTWLEKIRKEPVGSSLVIGTLGRTPVDTFFTRTSADFFFDRNETWDKILFKMSQYLKKDWECQFMIKKIKGHFRNKNWKLFKKGIDFAESHRLLRWEIEQQKAIYHSMHKNLLATHRSLSNALEINPCLPAIYMQLIQSTEGSEREHILNQAKFYCPNHPEILELIGSGK